MLVQRKWMYLEGIFIGGDIRAQLPEEAKKFDQIDKTFKRVCHTTMETRKDSESSNPRRIMLLTLAITLTLTLTLTFDLSTPKPYYL